MGDHVKTQGYIDTSFGAKDSIKSKASICSRRSLNSSCEKLNCIDVYSGECHISQTNSDIIDWMIKEYWETLPRHKLKSYIGIINKKINLFFGDIGEKHAALHKACDILAENYYQDERMKLEDECQKFFSSITFDDLKFFEEEIILKDFKEVYFNTPNSTAIWMKEKAYLKEFIQNALLQKIASLTKTKESWLEKVFRQQYEFFEVFTLMATEEGSHWIEMNKKDDSLLELIGFTIYKKPCQLADYTDEELDKIKPIAEQICSKSTTDTIKLSCIFIMYQSNGNEIIEPVFRIKDEKNVLFVDIKQRVYSSWDDFEKSNKLPACLYYYPFGAEYNKKEGFNVTFSWSPASYASKKVVRALDVVGKVATVGSAAALGAAATVHVLPVVAVGGAVAAVASGAYGLNRGIMKIWDKMNHKQHVNARDVVNVLSNVVSVASGGVAKVVPALATVGRSMTLTQTAVQGLTAITTLVPAIGSKNIVPGSGELPMKALLFFNCKSPQEVIEKLKIFYDLTPDKSAIFVIKTFVLNNSVESAHTGRIQRFISKPLAKLAIKLLNVAEEVNKTNYYDILILRDIFSDNEFDSLDSAFTNASQTERMDFFKFLMDCVFEISSLSVISVPLEGYRGVEFHPVPELFEQMDFGVIAKGSFAVDRYLGSQTLKKLQVYITKILSVICSAVEHKDKSLSQYSDLIKIKWSEILNVF